jgi:hypothetical protein
VAGWPTAGRSRQVRLDFRVEPGWTRESNPSPYLLPIYYIYYLIRSVKLGSLLNARAEIERRRTKYMLISAIGTAVSAAGAATVAIGCCRRRLFRLPLTERARARFPVRLPPIALPAGGHTPPPVPPSCRFKKAGSPPKNEPTSATIGTGGRLLLDQGAGVELQGSGKGTGKLATEALRMQNL